MYVKVLFETNFGGLDSEVVFMWGSTVFTVVCNLVLDLVISNYGQVPLKSCHI